MERLNPWIIGCTASITFSIVFTVCASAVVLFPDGTVNFFNGDQSTLLRTIGGTITFKNFGNNAGDRISGSLNLIIEDCNPASTPKPSYSIAADFDFITDSYGPVLP